MTQTLNDREKQMKHLYKHEVKATCDQVKEELLIK